MTTTNKFLDKVIVYIPSYKRPEYLAQKIIDIPYFVVTEDKYTSPRPELETTIPYTGGPGLSPKCNWIVEYHRKHYPDKYLFRMDDDIYNFMKAEIVNNKLKWNKKILLSEVLEEMILKMEETNAPLVGLHFAFSPKEKHLNTVGICSAALINTTVKTSNYSNEIIFLEDFLFAMDVSVETGRLPIKLMDIKFIATQKPEDSTIRNSPRFIKSVEDTRKLVDSKYQGLLKETPDNMYPLGINTREFYKKIKLGFYTKY